MNRRQFGLGLLLAGSYASAAVADEMSKTETFYLPIGHARIMHLTFKDKIASFDVEFLVDLWQNYNKTPVDLQAKLHEIYGKRTLVVYESGKCYMKLLA